MSKSIKTPAVEVAAETTKITRIKANSRGYAFLGKLSNAPDFSKLSHAEVVGEAGSPIREVLFNSEKKATSMLKRGYVAVGPDMECECEISSKGILITPVL